MRLREACRPLAPGFLAGLFVVVATVAFVGSWWWGWEPIRWTVVSASFRECTVLLGPVLAGAAAWTARVRHLVVCGPVPGRSWPAVAGRQLRLLLAVSVAGYLLGLAPVVVLAASRATAGAPDLLVMASGLALVAAWVCTGYAVGVLVRGVAAPAVAAALAVALAIVGHGVSASLETVVSTYPVVPVWMWDAGIGRQENPVVSAFRVVFLLAIGLAMVVIALTARRDGWVQRATGLWPLAAPAALGVVVVLAQPPIFVADPDAEAVCESVDGVQVCLNTEQAELLGPVADRVHRVLDISGPGMLTGRVLGRSLDASAQGDVAIGNHVVTSTDAFLDTVTETVAATVLGREVCRNKEYLDGTEWVIPEGVSASSRVSDTISDVVVRRAEGLDLHPADADSEIDVVIASWSDAELREWVAAHHDQLAECALSAQDVLG